MHYYGHDTPDVDAVPRYPLAAWVWGHRLLEGQHWMEYLLEFLNVLAGFDYELGQGITQGSQVPMRKERYTRYTRFGLRRFIFYDEQREKMRNDANTAAATALHRELENLVRVNGNQSSLVLVRTLLRSFSAVEYQRSWYAKSLFPINHELLFWQGDRNTAKGYQQREATAEPPVADTTVTLTKRNFYARGGEVYYLILSAGTEADSNRRLYIANRLERLLKHSHQAVGSVARLIDTTWERISGNPSSLKDHGTLGWIPTPDSPLYGTIAEDVAMLLQIERDPIETLDLLAHLMGFHLTGYIYHHARPDRADAHQSLLLIDALEGADGGVIRQFSAALFREQEVSIVQRGQQYVTQVVQEWAQQYGEHTASIAYDLWAQAASSFNLSRKTVPTWVEHLHQQLDTGTLNRAACVKQFAENLFTQELRADFDKNFVGVHRKLTKGVGFVAPKMGTGGRFVLGDTLLKALTLANVSATQAEMPYGDFLRRLYQRYGLIVGRHEAEHAGLFDRQPLDREYYKRNADALLEKMKRAGLAVEYSDTTAMVTIGTR